MPVTVVATPEPDSARVKVVASGGAVGETLYVFRRDSSGVGVVRDTSAGTVHWPPVGPPVAVNLIPNGDLADATGTTITGLVAGTASRTNRDAEHPVPGGSGWSARIRWGSPAYPSSTRYPSPLIYPGGSTA